MSDKYTTWETNLIGVLATELGATYFVTNDESMSCTDKDVKYLVLLQWVTNQTALEAGTTCFDSRRRNFRLILTPSSGVLPGTANEQVNIMVEAVEDVLSDYSKVNSTTIGGGYTVTEINIDSTEKGYFNKRLAAQMFMSFLADDS